MLESVFSARTRLVADGGPVAPTAVADGLATLERRWNQFGVALRVGVAAEADGVIVRYRLAIAGHTDPDDVHAAFRGDLTDSLRGIVGASRTASPASWDLAAMARAAEEIRPDRAAAAEQVYEEDCGYDWER